MGASPERRYEYKISRDGEYLGSLENVESPFGYSQNINSAGAQMQIIVGQSADITELPPDPILDENGDPLLDENGDIIYAEQAAEIVGDSNDQILIRNDNDVEVWEYSDDHINGVIVYSGYISKWRGKWGGDDDIKVTCLNHSQDLNHYLTPGGVADALDQSQTIDVDATDGPTGTWFNSTLGAGKGQRFGQTYTVGGGVNNLSAITVKLSQNMGINPGTFTMNVWNSVADANAGVVPLASVSKQIPAVADFSTAEFTYVFAPAIAVTPGQTIFFAVDPDPSSTSTDTNTWGGFSGSNSDVYAGGQQYRRNASNPYIVFPSSPSNDWWFKTYYSFNSTTITYENEDPSTVLDTVMDYYSSQGGHVLKPSGGYNLTGVNVPEITFKINTILEAIQKIVATAPFDWYWYIDPATEVLEFKQTSTTAQHRFIKGVHIHELDIEATKEQIVNVVYFSGGKVGPENLFVVVSDSQSLAENRRGLARLSDITVTDESTAQLIAQNYIDQHSQQTYTTTVTIPFDLYDPTLLNLGDVVNPTGFGLFVDSLLLQIVNKTINSDSVTLTLGVLLPRQTALAAQLRQELTALQTIDNPDSPS